MKDYKILKASDPNTLMDKVNKYLSLGYTLVGAPFLFNGAYWCQAVVLPEIAYRKGAI